MPACLSVLQVESTFLDNMVEHLNAECVLKTVVCSLTVAHAVMMMMMMFAERCVRLPAVDQEVMCSSIFTNCANECTVHTCSFEPRPIPGTTD